MHLKKTKSKVYFALLLVCWRRKNGEQKTVNLLDSPPRSTRLAKEPWDECCSKCISHVINVFFMFISVIKSADGKARRIAGWYVTLQSNRQRSNLIAGTSLSSCLFYFFFHMRKSMPPAISGYSAVSIQQQPWLSSAHLLFFLSPFLKEEPADLIQAVRGRWKHVLKLPSRHIITKKKYSADDGSSGKQIAPIVRPARLGPSSRRIKSRLRCLIWLHSTLHVIAIRKVLNRVRSLRWFIHRQLMLSSWKLLLFRKSSRCACSSRLFPLLFTRKTASLGTRLPWYSASQ